MRKNLLLLFVAWIATSMASFAQGQGVAQEAAGAYTGSLKVSSDGVTMGQPSTENIYLIATDDTHVTLEIRDFKFTLGTMTVPLGDVIVEGAEVSKEGNTIQIHPTDATLELIQPIGQVQVHLQASSITDHTLTLALTVETIYPTELVIDVDFTGKTNSESIYQAATDKFTIYPSATTDRIQVKGAPEHVAYSIYNITGSHINSGVLSSNTISVSGLAKGIYLLKIGNRAVKFVKK